MFDLNAAVAQWRHELAAVGINDVAVLDELESHLRDFIEQRVASGSEVNEAFRAGLARMGQPAPLEREFLRAAPLGTLLLAPAGQNLAVTTAGFIALSSLPIVMVMYPKYYANAFSSAGPWTSLTWLNMAGLVALWTWTTCRLAAARRYLLLRNAPPPMHHALRFGFIISGVLAFSLLPLVLEDQRGVLAEVGMNSQGLALAVAAGCFCGAFFSKMIWDRWAALCRSHRACVTVERSSRLLCVFYGPIMIGLFYLMWCCARWSLGFWPPRAPNYDPTGMPASALVHILICGWAWLAPVAVILPGVRLGFAARAKDGSWLPRAVELAITLLLIAVTIKYFTEDPHLLLNWFLD